MGRRRPHQVSGPLLLLLTAVYCTLRGPASAGNFQLLCHISTLPRDFLDAFLELRALWNKS